MRVVLLVLYPVLLHAAIICQLPILMAAAFFSLSTAALLDGLKKRSAMVWGAYLVLNGFTLILSLKGRAIYLLYLPPVAIPLLLLITFYQSLQAGQVPMITGIADQAHGPLTPTIHTYTRNITKLWTLLFSFMVLDALLLPVFAGPEIWSLFTNVINYLLCGLLFVGEYYFRQWRYPGQSPTGFIRHVKLVISAPLPVYGKK